jgi:hypothetical protein
VSATGTLMFKLSPDLGITAVAGGSDAARICAPVANAVGTSAPGMYPEASAAIVPSAETRVPGRHRSELRNG